MKCLRRSAPPASTSRVCSVLVMGLVSGMTLLPVPAPAAGAVVGSAGAVRTVQVPVPAEPPDSTVQDEALLRRRVEALVRSGRGADAVELLEGLRRDGHLTPVLRRRLARLYRDFDRWQDLEGLLLENDDPAKMDIGQLRLLAEALYELDRPSEGRAVLQRILDRDPSDASLARLVANVLSQRGLYAEAIEVYLAARQRLATPHEFAQNLGQLYARLRRPVEAAREYARAVVASPLNLSLMRGQILELSNRFPDQASRMLAAVDDVASDEPEVPQLGIVAAELLVRSGHDEEAWERVQPLLDDPELVQELLRMALAGLADSRLPGADAGRVLDRLSLSARVARGLLGNPSLPGSLEPRVYDTLVRSLLGILENDAFRRLDPDLRQRRVDEVRETVLQMQREFAGNRLTQTAVLRLAEVYAEGLRRPQDALALYRAITLDPNAPKEQMQIARLGLARCTVAVGDTARARELFEAIGQDMDFVEGQGRAQYHLGLLDFMGGDYATAADRFKAVAMEQPRADYTNDALELAVILAEEEMNGVADSTGLRLYGHTLYAKATFDDDQREALLSRLAAEGDSPVHQRARLELARELRKRGHLEEALLICDRLVGSAPDSRYAPSTLDLSAAIALELGRPEEARTRWERLLVDYGEYVMLDKVRDRLRALERGDDGDEGELP